jgi:hypothetical protein
VKDINQSVREKVQKLHGENLLVVSRLAHVNILIVGFSGLVPENFKANIDHRFKITDSRNRIALESKT